MFWFMGIGLLFFVTSISIMFDDFGTGLLGVVIGLVLIGIGIFLLRKKRPQFFPLLAKKDFRTAFKALSKDYAAREAAYADLDRQIVQREAEHSQVLSMPDLTAATYNGLKRKYHYKDVAVVVRWEYGGHYGKSCASIGIQRGDALQLCAPKDKEQDPGSIALCWKGMEIGYMKDNRLRDMVRSWQAANLPVIVQASYVGGEDKLLVEFAFYGSPTK